MRNLDHLFPHDTSVREQYKYPKNVVSAEFKLPPRDDRVGHGTSLANALRSSVNPPPDGSADKPAGIALEFLSDPNFKLQLQSLELTRSGIELLNSRVEQNPADATQKIMHATVFIPEGKLGIFIRKVEAYSTENDKKSGLPRNKKLVESITAIRKASLRSFWTDAGEFPTGNHPYWWEIWLRDSTQGNDVRSQFKDIADRSGIQVTERELRFPERCVVLAKATVAQLSSATILFDILAELRLAKVMVSEFLQLSPAGQLEFIEAALSRVQRAEEDSAAVCLLDTGVNRGHPLLELAIHEEHVLAVDPNWTAADLNGHGTAMAGMALYGCLTEHLAGNHPIVVGHRLESVKIFRSSEENDPDLYGDVTSQAISRMEIAAPNLEDRVHCLTITADSRDEGYPSSWSASLDQIASGDSVEEQRHRLIIVAAGNLSLDTRHQYPQSNQASGVEDPAQSWNALTVGAYTEKTLITEPDFTHWQTIATAGRLSPCSRTSTKWSDKSWPIKPDIVMEGGNNAIDPATQKADHVDDLSLLTTRVSIDGASLTATGDTSAATAQAARYAATIWTKYPKLWPETIRALLVHSANWTAAMLAEFPHNKRHDRLRCYGYGVPDLEAALKSAANAATLIVEESLQPYTQNEKKEIKTNDMHLHNLPWPKDVLESLGEIEVRMRITLSYFIEPSPGRRGWTRKHRYQSHGLRFEVKRPTETDAEFRRRISKVDDDDEEDVDAGKDDRQWMIGDHFRRKGSLHSDTWTGTAADLASCGVIAVFPVSGWWRERKHLSCWNKQAKYSLIVSIETDSTDVDVYTPIATKIGIETIIPTDID